MMKLIFYVYLCFCYHFASTQAALLYCPQIKSFVTFNQSTVFISCLYFIIKASRSDVRDVEALGQSHFTLSTSFKLRLISKINSY